MMLDFVQQKGKKRTENTVQTLAHDESTVGKIPFVVALIVIASCVILWAIFSFLPPPAGGLSYGVLLFDEFVEDTSRASASLLWINPQRNTGTIIHLPQDLEYSSRTFGYFPISSAVRAYTISTASASTVASDTSVFFRIPMIGYLSGTGKAGESGYQLAQFILRTCKSSPHTVTLSECVGLIRAVLSPSFSLRSSNLPDSVLSPAKTEGTRALKRDNYRDWLRKNISGQEEIYSRFTVAVLNTTNSTGIARSAGEILEDFGFRIIRADQGTPSRDEGIVYINEAVAQNKQVRLFLSQILHVPIEVNGQETQNERSDIVYRIGKKEADFFSP